MEYNFPGLLRFWLEAKDKYVKFRIYEQASVITRQTSDPDVKRLGGTILLPIKSSSHIELAMDGVYLRGTQKNRVYDEVSRVFASPELAEKYRDEVLHSLTLMAQAHGVQLEGERKKQVQLSLWE